LKVDFVAKLFCIYRQLFLPFIAGKNLKLSLTVNCVLKRANDLKKNDFKLARFAFDALQRFIAVIDLEILPDPVGYIRER